MASVDPSPVGSYLICATPRSGSTLLCGLLASTGVAGRPQSYFRLPDTSLWADRWRLRREPDGSVDDADFCRAALAAGTTSNGVFAARVMWGTIEELAARLAAVHPDLADSDIDLLTTAFGPPRFVYLWRDDVVAQAVSWARAEQTGYWHPGDDPRAGRVPRFDHTQIHGLVHTIWDHNASWRSWFAARHISPYPVRYEDLAADPAAVCRGILDHLQLRLPAGRTITPRDRRQADAINDDWIARYRDVRGSAG